MKPESEKPIREELQEEKIETEQEPAVAWAVRLVNGQLRVRTGIKAGQGAGRK